MNPPRRIQGNERVAVGVPGSASPDAIGARYVRVPAGAADSPEALLRLVPPGAMRAAAWPTTLAAALREAGELDLSNPGALEHDDVWFLAPLTALEGRGAHVLVLEGLATLADVFVGTEHVLRSENAFLRHEIDVSSLVADGARTLAIRIGSLETHLRQKRPRPRWKTRLVANQNLRFVRTSLLGRTTGFCPAVPAVGPYRPVALERRLVSVDVERLHVRVESPARDEPGAHEGAIDGVVEVRLGVRLHDDSRVERAWLVVGDVRAPLAVTSGPAADTTNPCVLTGTCRVPNAARWWPHTHGEPTLYPASVVVERRMEVAGAAIDPAEIELGDVGFRTLALEPLPGFGLVVNGVPIFARGAVWTTEDVVAQHASRDRLRAALVRVRDAGMNLLRIAGTTGYESADFHELADELGILVFQDLAFANMDYPIADPAFHAEVAREIDQVTRRIGWRASTAVICGNSEVEQQAAMLGLPRELWRSPLARELAPTLAATHAPGVPYVPSSPCEGTMPFHVDVGLGHYYGVGAYLRPLGDARASGVRFAGECLAFANVPSRATLDTLLGDLESPVHHPRWKERVPRDRGASWDFEDVRDHYLEQLFGVSARTLRYENVERYLALARVTSGEVMARVFAEWRREGSPCRGGLVFFLQDFWAGAGFGLVDARGEPKAALRIVSRAMAPVALLAIDEGVNGLYAHLVNDRPEPIEAVLRARLVRDGEHTTNEAETRLVLAPHRTTKVHVDALFPGFVDTTYAYRFGPSAHDLVHLTLHTSSPGSEPSCLGRAHHLPLGLARPVERELGLEATFEDGGTRLRVRTKRLALFCALELEGVTCEDDFFHLAPGEERSLVLTTAIPSRTSAPRALRGTIHPMNQHEPSRIRG